MKSRPARLPILGLALLPAVTLAWGFHWPVMRTVVLEVPVWQYRAVTCGLAGLTLLAITRLRGAPVLPPRHQWPQLLVAATLNITLWQTLSAFGVLLLNSGRAAVLAFTMPLWATVFAVIFLGERFTVRTAVALTLGLAAIVVMVSADVGTVAARPAGFLVILLAAVAWGAGTVFLKSVAWQVPTGALAGWQLLLGAIPVGVIAVSLGPVTIQDASGLVLLCMSYTLVIALVLCYYAWFTIVRLFPASVAAIGILLTPVIGLFSGALVLGEPVGWREITALILVCGAVGLVLIRPGTTEEPVAEAPPEGACEPAHWPD